MQTLSFLHLTVGHDSMLGIRSPTMTDFGGMSVVLLNQYQQDPLVLYEEGFDQGAVIAKRYTTSWVSALTFSNGWASDCLFPPPSNGELKSQTSHAQGLGLVTAYSALESLQKETTVLGA